MATPAEIQTQLDPTHRAAKIVRSTHLDATYDAHYVVGQTGYAGRCLWVQTTAANNAATQAAAITTALKKFR
jgi:hypothetical protein